MIDLNGGSYKFEKGILKVMKGSMVVLKGFLKMAYMSYKEKPFQGMLQSPLLKQMRQKFGIGD